jgi:hypothetical protein
MYTIFFTINCVEQLTFYKTFVDQLQFEQLIFFLSKSETAQNTRTADDFWFSTSFHFFCQLLDLRRAVDIFVSTSFFELSQFEQFTPTRFNLGCRNSTTWPLVHLSNQVIDIYLYWNKGLLKNLFNLSKHLGNLRFKYCHWKL